uniref:Mediator of RNA polymerase II transcription subunit 10 n=1 Tax=Plectus sambesii TaxID=2011161 RepID=A0A914XAH7_9BILA
MAASGEASDPRLNTLEQTLEAFQENARQLGVIASDFQPKSQDALNQKLQTLVSGLQELDHMKNSLGDVKIPLELLDYLDQGKNPQLYTKEVIDRTLAKNQQVNGKIELYKKFRATLLKELSEEMPHETMRYRSIREKAGDPSGSMPNDK